MQWMDEDTHAGVLGTLQAVWQLAPIVCFVSFVSFLWQSSSLSIIYEHRLLAYVMYLSLIHI